jgi:hypothetical protein
MITKEFSVGQRNTSLLMKLYHPGGAPVVLGVADTVAFRMVNISTGAVKVNDAACAIVSRGDLATDTPAEARYDWAGADVDTAGEYAGWAVTSESGLPGYFPPQDPDNPQFRIVFYPVT